MNFWQDEARLRTRLQYIAMKQLFVYVAVLQFLIVLALMAIVYMDNAWRLAIGLLSFLPVTGRDERTWRTTGPCCGR